MLVHEWELKALLFVFFLFSYKSMDLVTVQSKDESCLSNFSFFFKKSM